MKCQETLKLINLTCFKDLKTYDNIPDNVIKNIVSLGCDIYMSGGCELMNKVLK